MTYRSSSSTASRQNAYSYSSKPSGDKDNRTSMNNSGEVIDATPAVDTTWQKNLQADKKRDEAEMSDQMNDTGPGVAATSTATEFAAKGFDPAQAAMLAYSAASAAQASATQAALSKIGQIAATAAAALKLSNDLTDATINFMKNIGSSVKSASQ